MENLRLSSHAKKVIFERNIKLTWIENTFNNPDKIEIDLYDNTLEHRLKIINQYDNRILRFIYNKTVNPVLVITAFFDRRMKGKLL